MHGGMNPDPEDLAALMTWLEANGDRYRFEPVPGCIPTPVRNLRPGTLAAVDPGRDHLESNPDLWYEMQRGSA